MEITTSFVFLRADVDKCLRLVLLLLLPSTMTCSPLLLKNDDDGCATDVLKRPACVAMPSRCGRRGWRFQKRCGEKKKIRVFQEFYNFFFLRRDK